MSGAVARYAYLNARVSGMADRLLPAAEVEALIEGSTPEQAAHALIPDLADLGQEAQVDPAFLESALLLALLQEFSVLVRGTHGNARDLLIYWIRRFELANLKALLRGKVAGRSAAAIRAELVRLGPFATLPADRLLATEDLAELLRQLETTAYGSIVHQARLAFEEQPELFILDATLDQRYFTGLARQLRGFDGKDRQLLNRLVGSYIDHVNLVWLLRYRYAYNLPPAQAFYLLAPAGHRIAAREWLALADLGSMAELIGALPRTLAQLLEGAETISEVQRRLQRETQSVAESVLRDGGFSVARALAYLLLRELQMQQLLAVLKGRQLGLDSALIRFAAGFGGQGRGGEARV